MGASHSSPATAKHVVVVGGSFGGLEAAKRAHAAGLRVTVIEPKDRFSTVFGGVRAMVVPAFEDSMLFPYDKVFPAGSSSKFVRGWATGVDPAARTITYQPLDASARPSGPPTALQYDYLILALGCSNTVEWHGQHSQAEYKALLAATRAAIAAAPSVLVVGAGAVGIELCGEIRDHHPTKPVTLATGGEVLSNDAAAVPKFRAAITAEIAAAGIALRAGVRPNVRELEGRPDIVSLSPGVFAARTPGATFAVSLAPSSPPVEVGLVIATTGSRPLTAWLKEGPLGSALDAAGYIRVGRTYQVQGQDSVFAIGDCTATAGGEGKGVFRAEDQAGIAAGNAAALARGAGRGALALGPDFAKQAPFMSVPVGRSHGMAQMPGLCDKNLVSFVAGFKAKQYLVDIFAGKVKYTVAEGIAANSRVPVAVAVDIAVSK
jgi:NADH dehydrogenase FAD-containing subunit